MNPVARRTFLQVRYRFDSPKEKTMAKGQQKTNKEGKKPKKDTSPPKPVSPDAVRPTVTTVVPVRGKLKNK
jgi:hypothetical protein